jgi:hypothetical protein
VGTAARTESNTRLRSIAFFSHERDPKPVDPRANRPSGRTTDLVRAASTAQEWTIGSRVGSGFSPHFVFEYASELADALSIRVLGESPSLSGGSNCPALPLLCQVVLDHPGALLR